MIRIHPEIDMGDFDTLTEEQRELARLAADESGAQDDIAALYFAGTIDEQEYDRRMAFYQGQGGSGYPLNAKPEYQ